MSDADDARMARSLSAIEHYMKKLVRVLETMNENFVEVGKSFKNISVDDDQLTFTDGNGEPIVTNPDNDAVEIHDIVDDINHLQGDAGRETTVTQPQDTDG